MKPPNIEHALAERTLRPGPKRVIFANPAGPSNDRPYSPPNYTMSSDAALSLAKLLRILKTDCDPVKLAPYYRQSPGGDDLLLGPWRCMHLHLGNAGSDDIVYLLQLPDSLIIMEVSDHRHLKRPFPGKNLPLQQAKAAAAALAIPLPTPARKPVVVLGPARPPLTRYPEGMLIDPFAGQPKPPVEVHRGWVQRTFVKRPKKGPPKP
ncbi:hypothetical protein D9599_19490 [Roseomonas sp. KE2513]|uniref:hypothetical protein n=1 Tax=Roseomonas sp. KE2513 TaxID=2479202 RepID=UPI0018DFAFF7|nr:hypothetical protein [Roseomonas sp. KE2513]MBI0537748.1 hypothetical protein [Roseomonas sp. KE2513]